MNDRLPILAANAVILAAAAFLVILMYRSGHHYTQGVEDLGSFLYYYMLPATALLLLLRALWLDRSRRQSVALALSVSAATLLMAEASLRLIGDPLSTHALAAREHGIPFDERSSEGVIRDLAENEGVQAWPNIAPTYLLKKGFRLRLGERELLPLAGIANAQIVYCNETGEYILYRSDEYGFHNPGELHTHGPDIVILGDSFAQGGCVGSHENTAASVRRSVDGTLNLGMGGNGPLLELATLIEYAAPLAPRIVLWFYYEGNDLFDLEHERRQPILTSYFEHGRHQGLKAVQTEIDEQLSMFVVRQRIAANEHKKISKIFALDGLRKRVKQLLIARKAAPPLETDVPFLIDVLTKSRDLTAAWGGTFYVVYLPAWRRYSGHQDEPPMRDRREVLRQLESSQIPLIDLHPIFAAQPDPLALFALGIDGHYTAKGYGLVAEAIIERLTNDSKI